MRDFFSISNVSDILGTSIKTVESWCEKGIYKTTRNEFGKLGFLAKDIKSIPSISSMIENNHWEDEMKTQPKKQYNSIELFAGGGGLAIGMEKAGFHHILLNEFDKNACATLKYNRPEWNVVEEDIHNIDFTPFKGQVDFLSGGFPCQAFSYAGEKKGFEDARGTLFFELARAVKETQPKVFLGENVKGLFTHDNGKTLQVIKDVIADLGYTLVEPRVLKAIMYFVPQKRERLMLVAIRNDFVDKVSFKWPDPYHRVLTLRDAFYKGILYDTDVPQSDYQKYPKRKEEIMSMVPEGGYWKDLPDEIQREYMKNCYFMEGGRTGIARRLALDEPSLTLTCAPAMKQTERCHPIETRPLTIREYARIQTFPDQWEFKGNMSAQYKQIGNAVPVNLAYAMGRAIIRLLNDIEDL